MLQRAVDEASSSGRGSKASQLRSQLCSGLCALAEMHLALAGEGEPSEEVEGLLRR